MVLYPFFIPLIRCISTTSASSDCLQAGRQAGKQAVVSVVAAAAAAAKKISNEDHPYRREVSGHLRLFLHTRRSELGIRSTTRRSRRNLQRAEQADTQIQIETDTHAHLMQTAKEREKKKRCTPWCRCRAHPINRWIRHFHSRSSCPFQSYISELKASPARSSRRTDGRTDG